MRFPLATIEATEVRVVHSEVAGRDYEISVALPYHYRSEPERRWPVVYLLDANLYLGLVVDMVRAMNIRVEICNELPDAFVVGIGYPVEGSLAESLDQVMHLRLRDFLASRELESERFVQDHFPVTNPVESGDADGFMRFLEQELIPLIDEQYPVDPTDRVLIGHSWAGDFVLNTLFRRPELFHRYVAASATPSPDDEIRYAESHDDLPVRLHLVMEDGNAEGVSAQKSFVERLRGRRYPRLTLTDHVILEGTHCAMVPQAFQSGLVSVFR